ncbi:MAG: hypothetical protein N3A62_01275 [Thermodesulfovibrionales bacterium]|nr:hypothetical protein [Thermodesulfovibrionales bacterium]
MAIPDDFKRRLSSDRYPFSVFFYRSTENLISEITNYLTTDIQRLYLKLYKTEKQLIIDYRIYKGEDFHLDTGLSRYPRPPTWILYLSREYSLWIILFGILTYIFLPVRTISPKALRYICWRVVVGGLVAFLLTFMFFSMLYFIIGIAQQTVTPWIMFSGVFWGTSLLGVCAIKIATEMVNCYNMACNLE